MTIPQKKHLLESLYAHHRNIEESPLYIKGCKSIVFGEGNPNAQLMFVGEAPGKNEDEQGRPFVGQSGKLLEKALSNAGISRKEVFITNIVKCRPPKNRTPYPSELKIGKESMLNQQIDIIQPKIICTLGSAALQGLLGEKLKITKIHGKPISYKKHIIFPVYHPAYILRNRKAEKHFLEDIMKAVTLSQNNPT